MVVDSSLLTSVPWHLMPLSVSGLSCPQSFIQCVFYFFLVSFLSVGFYTICHFSLCFFLIKIFIFLTSLCSSPRLYLMFLSNILHWKKKSMEIRKLWSRQTCVLHPTCHSPESGQLQERVSLLWMLPPLFCFSLPWVFQKYYSAISPNAQSIFKGPNVLQMLFYSWLMVLLLVNMLISYI